MVIRKIKDNFQEKLNLDLSSSKFAQREAVRPTLLDLLNFLDNWLAIQTRAHNDLAFWYFDVGSYYIEK